MHKVTSAKDLKDGDVIVEAFGSRTTKISNVDHKDGYAYFTADVMGVMLRDRIAHDWQVTVDVSDDHPITLADEDEVQLNRLLSTIIERAWSLRATIGNAGVLEPIEVDENSDVWDDVSVIGASISEVNTTFFGRGGPIG